MLKLNKKNYFVIVFLMLNITLIAQSKVGTTIGQFLKIDPNSRIVGMGNAGVSAWGDANASYYNPASLGRLLRTEVNFTFNKWIAGITYNNAQAALPIDDFGTLSINAIFLNSGEINVRTVEQPMGTGERYRVTNFSLGLGFGKSLTDRISVGFQINYNKEQIWNSSLEGFTLNMGVQYIFSKNGGTLGASVSNFGPRASYNGRDLFLDYDFDPEKHGDNDQLPAALRTNEYLWPTIFRVGLSYPIEISESYRLLIAADAIHPNDNEESINAGAELMFFNSFAIRGGYRNIFLHNSEGGLVLGAGIKIFIEKTFRVKVDYAYADYGRLNEAHRITLTLGL